jgi:hypothetical protein
MGRATPSSSLPTPALSPAAAAAVADDEDEDEDEEEDDDDDVGAAQPCPGMKKRFCRRQGTRMSCSGNSCRESSPCSCAQAWIMTKPPGHVMRSSSAITAKRRADGR